MMNTIGMVPSFGFLSSQINGPVNVRGQTYGTDAQAAVGINEPTIDPVNNQGTGQSMAGRTAGNMPVLWLLIMMAVGVIILAHVARVSVG